MPASSVYITFCVSDIYASLVSLHTVSVFFTFMPASSVCIPSLCFWHLCQPRRSTYRLCVFGIYASLGGLHTVSVFSTSMSALQFIYRLCVFLHLCQPSQSTYRLCGLTSLPASSVYIPSLCLNIYARPVGVHTFSVFLTFMPASSVYIPSLCFWHLCQPRQSTYHLCVFDIYASLVSLHAVSVFLTSMPASSVYIPSMCLRHLLRLLFQLVKKTLFQVNLLGGVVHLSFATISTNTGTKAYTDQPDTMRKTDS